LLASAHDRFQDGKDPQRAAALLAVGDSCNALHESKKALDY
jgi:hypothetical protein